MAIQTVSTSSFKTAVHQLMRQASAEIILPRFRQLGDGQISKKLGGELVTIADIETEDFLAPALELLWPGSLAMGEETVAREPGKMALVDATKELGAMQGVGDVTISGSTSIGQETSTAKISSVPSTSVGNETPSSPPTPFAVIDDVVSGSPAETGGLQIGDQIVSFGDVSKNAEQGRDISQVAAASVTAAAAGETKIVTVLRRGAVVTLEVQPRTWQGRGFLGCHMRPL